MLKTDHVGVAEIQVIGRAAIGVEIVFVKLESHLARVFVALKQIVDRCDEAFRLRVLLRNGLAQVVRKGRDPAFAREVIAQEGDLFDFGVEDS